MSAMELQNLPILKLHKLTPEQIALYPVTCMPLVSGQAVYTRGVTDFSPWLPAQVLQVISDSSTEGNNYVVRTKKIVLTVNGKFLAYSSPAGVPLKVGYRVIAKFDDNFFIGIIIENAKSYNRFRYLVYLDDGRTGYCDHQNVRLIVNRSQQVTDDIQRMVFKEWICYHLNLYPWRSTVPATVGQYLTVLCSSGVWKKAEILNVDCSLIEVQFPFKKKTEWIFNGSPRIHSIYQFFLANKERPKDSLLRSKGFGSFTVHQDNTRVIFQEEEEEEERVTQLAPCWEDATENLQKKKITRQRLTKGKIEKWSLDGAVRPQKMLPHVCGVWCGGQICSGKGYNPEVAKEYHMLVRPLMFGFQRKKDRSGKVTYTAPCGLVVDSPARMHNYLMVTESPFTIDLFTFDREVHVLNRFKEGKTFVNIQNVTNCACRQLTLEGLPPNTLDYQFRRLPTIMSNAIYECNSRCKCSSSCLNRVAQNPMMCKLQLFKTAKKGWGLRCLHDLPKGTFICTYEGDLLTEQQSIQKGKKYGDEYLAELDFIEVCENKKEGYEEEAIEQDVEGDDSECTIDDDPDYKTSSSKLSSNTDVLWTTSRLRTRKLLHTTEINFSSGSTRSLFGPEEKEPYIIDAKTQGNIGRYFNHSCSPNVKVQNIFINTHDLRYPTVAFFTNQYVPAGRELTWCYNYDIGSTDRIVKCYCRSNNCSGRLL